MPPTRIIRTQAPLLSEISSQVLLRSLPIRIGVSLQTGQKFATPVFFLAVSELPYGTYEHLHVKRAK